MRKIDEQFALICCIVGGLFFVAGTLLHVPVAFAFAAYFFIRSIHMAIYSNREPET